MSWTSLEDEASLLASLAESGRVAVDVAGQSVLGRPLRVVRVGHPEPPSVDKRAALLLVGCQHGHEPAGREAILGLLQHLATTTDPDELLLLEEFGVVAMPTTNPDGFNANSRENANGVDLNRDHIELTQPETRVIASVLGRTRPLVAVDTHETSASFTEGEDVAFLGVTHVQAHADIRDGSDTLIAAIKTAVEAESWTTGDYQGTPNGENRLRDNGGLRHTVTVLVETLGFGAEALDEQDRVDISRICIDTALDHVVDNAAALLAQADTASADKAAEGAAGAEPFDIRTEVIDPPPLGYQLTVSQTHTLAFHLQVYNIARSGPHGLTISMAQQSQPVIPFIADAAATFSVVSGVRLFTLEADPPPPATVQELAPIVSRSHRVRVEARVVTGLPTGLDPDGVEIPVLGGSVTWDGTADILGSVELTTVARWPRARERLLLPAGNEIFLRYGVDVGGAVGTLWTPLGYFRINRPSQDDVARGPITLSGEDRMCRILDARLLRPRQLSVGRTLGNIFAELVLEAMPEATIIFDDDTEYATIARTLTTEESRYKVLRELADAAGKMLYWDGEGVLRVESPPDPAEPVWHLRAGPGGALISASREISREQVYNAVVARGEGSEMADPVEAVAYDDDPDSMTYFFGPFGMVPRFYASPVISTEDQAYSAAVSMLRRSLGLPYEVAGEIAPNPALRPGDPVRFTWDDGNRELHVWETLELPLDGESPMSGTTQQQTMFRVGRA